SLNVTGDILDRNDFTTVPLATAPDFTPFQHLAPSEDALLANLPGQFFYDPKAHTLTFQGPMTSEEMNALVSLQVEKLDPVTQKPLLDPTGKPIVQTISILDPATAQALFTASQSV